jgi:predicted dehydrogenase
MIRTVAGLLLCSVLVRAQSGPAAEAKPLRLAIAGLVHGHVSGFLQGARPRKDVEIAGVFDPDPALLASYAKTYALAPEILFTDLAAMLDRVKPESVATFTSTYDHAMVVEACARRHIAVMMEKPLAVNMTQARAIEKAARDSGISVMVNYETTWYKSHAEIWKIFKQEKALGEIRKMVAMDGHRGPEEVNVQPEFLAWLKDPVKNGAGALFDFGCYGANLMTWLMDNQRPLAVTAIVQTNKPAIYPESTTRPPSWCSIPRLRASSRPPGTGPSTARIWRSMAKQGMPSPPAATACAFACQAAVAQRRRVRWRIFRPPTAIPSRT